jgi:branched-chain amino acid transport system substrate-binding protein
MSAAEGIRLGIAVSLTGPYALFGRQALEGLRRFVRDCERAGGVRDPRANRPVPLELVAEDDRGDARCARRIVDTLIRRDAVDLLIGPYGSGPVLAAAEVAERRRFVLWNHGGSSDEIFRRGYRWTVGILSPASQYLVAVLELLRFLDPRLRKVAVLAAKTGFASEVAAGARDWIERAGLGAATRRFYDSGTDDFAPILHALEEDSPDVLVGVGRFEDDLRLARGLVESKLRVNAAGLVGAAVGEFARVLGRGAEGFFGPSQWEPGIAYPVDCGPTAEEFRAAHGRPEESSMDYPGAQAYAAGIIAVRCVGEAGSLDQGALREAAARLRCTTFYGPFAIDPATGRQIAHSLVVTQWQRGEKKVVWPPIAAEARADYPAPPGRHRSSR